MVRLRLLLPLLLLPLLVALLASGSALGQGVPVPFCSSLPAWARIGNSGTAGTEYFPIEVGPTDISAFEVIAGSRGAWVTWLAEPDDADEFRYRVAAPLVLGAGVVLNETPTLWPAAAAPPLETVVRFLGLADPPVTDAAAIWIPESFNNTWQPSQWIPPGRALQVWTPIGATNYTLSIHVLEPLQ